MLTRKPHKGETVRFRKAMNSSELEATAYTVIEAKDDGICWMQAPGAKDATCFIWKFRRTGEYNALAEIV